VQRWFITKQEEDQKQSLIVHIERLKPDCPVSIIDGQPFLPRVTPGGGDLSETPERNQL